MPTSPRQTAASAYLAACQREQTECALEFLKALSDNEKEALLNHRARALLDADLVCIADALRCKHSIRVLSLEENHITSSGVQAILDALLANPGYVRELRLGKNRLRDAAAVTVANALAFSGAGLKVLDLSENGLTKLGVGPLFQAISGKHSDLVELSLHNNSLEADSAAAIAQALRHGGGPAKLKHLHLGYNSLRDGGATQLARAIPLAPTLCTLDLTANRIGPQGGMELARALLSPNCTLQRLNLRHNLFDDDTFAAFADVIIKNTSLTQLFLGFMRPSHATAASVLSTLRYNRTLLLFDCYGWTFAADDMVLLLENILNSNPTIRAIVTDNCQGVAHQIDVFNKRREDSGSHRVYIGGEDRFANDAVVAAKSLQQQSHHRRSSTRDTTPETSALMPPHGVGAGGVGQRRGPPLVGIRNVPLTRAASNGSPVPQPATRLPYGDRDIDALLAELKDVSMDADLRRNLSLIVSQLQLKIDTLRTLHHEQMASLEDRVRSLEQRPCAHSCQGTVIGGGGAAGTATAAVFAVPTTRPPPQLQQQRSPSAGVSGGFSLDVTPTSGGEGTTAQQLRAPPHIRIVGRPVTPPARPEDAGAAGSSMDRPGTPEPSQPTAPDAQHRHATVRGVPAGRPTSASQSSSAAGATTAAAAAAAAAEDSSSGRPRSVPPISFAKMGTDSSRNSLPSQSPPVTSTVGQRRSASNPAAAALGGESSSRRSVSQPHAVSQVGPRRGEGSASTPASGAWFAEQQSPINPHLQPSQQVTAKGTAVLEASPHQQQRVSRKRPPAST